MAGSKEQLQSLQSPPHTQPHQNKLTQITN